MFLERLKEKSASEIKSWDDKNLNKDLTWQAERSTAEQSN